MKLYFRSLGLAFSPVDQPRLLWPGHYDSRHQWKEWAAASKTTHLNRSGVPPERTEAGEV